MENPSTGEARSDLGRARRQQLRTEAARADSRARSSARRRQFETPEWLDHSFVLPLTRPEVTSMPAQPLPDHDDLGDHDDLVQSGDLVQGREDSAWFVRPHSKEIDFARVIKRAEGERLAGRAAAVSTGVTGLAVIGYLITGATPALVVMVVSALIAVLALVLGRRLSAAPIPHLDA